MANEMDDAFKTKLEVYLRKHAAFADARIVSATRLTGGVSRTTVKVDLLQTGSCERSLIVRMDPAASLVESGRHAEYAAYQAFGELTDVIVPEAVFNEDDPVPLGAPFMVASLLPGTAAPTELLTADYEFAAPRIARESFDVLGRIAAIDHRALADRYPFSVPELDNIWCSELERWEQKLYETAIGPLPAISAVLRHLRRRPPSPTSRLAVIHGDYRLGNYLFRPSGITGILDWEMVHIGDPLEDLAWAMLPNWRFKDQMERIVGFLTPEEAISIWERSSGISVDRTALAWWTLLCHVKLTALWAGAVRALRSGASKEVRFAQVAYAHIPRQEMWMMADMRRALA